MSASIRRSTFSTLCMAAVLLLLAGPGHAQATVDTCEPIYKKLLDNRKGPGLTKFQIALAAGNEYLTKCSNLEGQEQIKDYVTKQVPNLTKIVKEMELIERFNTAVPAKNWDEAAASAKELLASKHAASLDIMIVLASIGLTNASANPPVDKFNNDAVSYARAVIKDLEAGAKTENYGAYQFGYKTKECPEGKANTISWMNYTIGLITFLRENRRKDALPFLYKAQQAGCELKNSPEIFRWIGSWYTDEAIKLNAARDEKIKASGNQETDEIRSGAAIISGYLGRAMDAYARAIKNAGANTSQAYRDALRRVLEGLFSSRHDGRTDGVDKFISEVEKRPFLDPATPVQPVFDPPAAPSPSAPAVPTQKKP